MARLTLLSTSSRLPAGLLSWQAWEALRAGVVLTGAAEHPLLPYLAAAGVTATVVPDQPVAERAEQLFARAAAGEQVVWLSAGAADEPLARRLGLLTASGGGGPVELELLHASYDPPGAALLELVAVMDRLRGPGGCPWDAEQTHESLAPYLLEEAYEAYEALEQGDRTALRDELGDVLLQVVFHARVAEERSDATRFDIDGVAEALVAKLVRRHPHVFAGTTVSGSWDVQERWDQIKAAERGAGGSVTDGVAMGQPALALAAKLARRAERAGVAAAGFEPAGEGAALWSEAVGLAGRGQDPEAALREVARRFRDWLVAAETSARVRP